MSRGKGRRTCAAIISARLFRKTIPDGNFTSTAVPILPHDLMSADVGINEEDCVTLMLLGLNTAVHF